MTLAAQIARAELVVLYPAPAHRNVAKVLVEHGDCGRRVLDERLQQRAAVLERQLGALALGNVVQRAEDLTHRAVGAARERRLAAQEPVECSLGGAQPILVFAHLTIGQTAPFSQHVLEVSLILRGYEGLEVIQPVDGRNGRRMAQVGEDRSVLIPQSPFIQIEYINHRW